MDSKPAVECVSFEKVTTKDLPEARLSRLATPPQTTFVRKRLVGFEPTVFVAENNNGIQQAVGMLFQMTDEDLIRGLYVLCQLSYAPAN